VREEDQVEAAAQTAAEGRRRPAHLGLLRGTGWAQKVAGSKGPPPPPARSRRSCRSTSSGTFNVLRLAATAMLRTEPDDEGERGVCVNTASIAAYDGQIGQVAYAASKGGVVGLTLPPRAIWPRAASGWSPSRPGLFDTPLLAALPEEARTALGRSVPFPPRLGRPDEYAAVALHIVENRMLNGETVRLDGALRMAPR
jgi:NAD(P)-dependent dehydrogenase (short-subunit alcohol dehydrogenase family)